MKRIIKKLKKCFKKYNVKIDLSLYSRGKNWLIFTVDIKAGTTLQNLNSSVQSVQAVLGIPYLIHTQHGCQRYLFMSYTRINSIDLLEMLDSRNSDIASQELKLPIAVGVNIFRQLDYEDLSDLMHTAYTGSTGSGKSVGLQCLILSLATLRSVSEVNLMILDAGGTTLECFEGLPHLSCPVASSVSQCIYALKALVLEMNRRLKLSREELAELPYIVCVFDEFLAALEKDNRDGEKELKDLINDLLRRARKVKIFLILASQSTKQEHLKGIGLTNLTSRVSFRSDSKSNSQSELGCPGAEKLMGKGDMLLKTSAYDAPLRLQGAYISEDEIIEQVKFLAEQPYDDSNKFVIPEFVPSEYAIDQVIDSIPKKSDDGDEKYAQVLICTLAQTKVSGHALYKALGKKLRLGEKKFVQYMDRMYENGFISEYNGTQPRKVLINSIEDLTEEQMEFLTKYGHTEEQLTKLFDNKNNS